MHLFFLILKAYGVLCVAAVLFIAGCKLYVRFFYVRKCVRCGIRTEGPLCYFCEQYYEQWERVRQGMKPESPVSSVQIAEKQNRDTTDRLTR